MRREFPGKVKARAFERAAGRCESCTAKLFPGNVHYDHVVPDALGGEPTLENCEALCKACHGTKTRTKDVPSIAKVKRIRLKNFGGGKRSTFPCSRTSRFKQKIGGRVVLR
ncbi:MAG TPA: HNH endonuclease signature motif containing protein [Nitrospirota bacterium]